MNALRQHGNRIREKLITSKTVVAFIGVQGPKASASATESPESQIFIDSAQFQSLFQSRPSDFDLHDSDSHHLSSVTLIDTLRSQPSHAQPQITVKRGRRTIAPSPPPTPSEHRLSTSSVPARSVRSAPTLERISLLKPYKFRTTAQEEGRHRSERTHIPTLVEADFQSLAKRAISSTTTRLICPPRHSQTENFILPKTLIASPVSLPSTHSVDQGLLVGPSLTIIPSMTSEVSSTSVSTSTPAQHKPLVVGRTKPQPATMDPSSSSGPIDKAIPAEAKAALNHEIAENVKSNTSAPAPVEGTTANNKKKEKAPKQPKPPKAPATPAAPVSPALIDLRVGHILRAIAHPNADSLYVSTIAMGDPEGTEHTQVDEETGKVVRTVCSGLNGLVPLEEMQNRKVVVVANLKPVNMRSIKSAAMVLAASPPMEEGADPHAADRTVELVNPPEGSEAGDAVYFEGWPYGEGKGPEKQLNPKKKVWESVQPGFFTSEECVVGFDAGRPGVEIEGDKEKKGWLIVEGKGRCTVQTLKGAVVR
ncbi:uncharacterized protein Z519_01427 [Cladophialophora bantiana CBS 173.52]|uniref:tRNA-binding domain-containing protein n=1 Tax=Cladophialophora bantiana (strain ATCC 10958 / CBS 173.52 / CDC B-1940 / NIH 8579) TaxID=1442370 RepID=A0A0D2HWT9_CLAB1|nr:uncharacterized protein Z519_01427 [Cladophialophora bantiana CBS 173.52]KIW97843.1 hypothetical protein Z519_01427 [Cladophialophora bantiana CBS 173.52]